MKAQFENKVMSSLLLFVDHQLLKHGEAFDNTSSYFYPTTQTFANYFNYSAPYKQIVSDHSITGATQLTGVYLDGNFTVPGQSNLNSINHLQGEVHFTSEITGSNRISGDYSVKEFNTYLTTKSEEELLFETKFQVKPKINQTVTGLNPETQTYPAVFIKSVSSEDTPFSFGGTDQTNINARLVVLADSAFSLDAACSILRDVVKSNVFLIQDELPFNAFGAYTGKAFNYTGIATGGDKVFVDRAYVSKNVGNLRPYDKINPQMHSAFVDYELIVARKPRQFND